MNVPPSRSATRELRVARAGDEVAAHGRDLRERQPLGAADDGDDEPLRRRDRDADVRAREDEQRVLGVLDVHVGVAHERLRADLRQQVGDGDAHVRVELALLRDQLVRARHVGAHGELERRAPSTPASGGARSSCGRSRAGRDSTSPPAAPVQVTSLSLARRGLRLGALDVLGDDPPVRPRAAQAGEVDAAFARDPARERRRLDAAVRARRSALGPRPPAARSTFACNNLLLAGSALRDGERATSSPCGADEGDRPADLDLAGGDRDLQQDARRLGLDLLRHLVGVELVERLALGDRARPRPSAT